jgi:hypothetical protein
MGGSRPIGSNGDNRIAEENVVAEGGKVLEFHLTGDDRAVKKFVEELSFGSWRTFLLTLDFS